MGVVLRSVAFAAAIFGLGAASSASAAPVLDQTDIPATGALSGIGTGLGVGQDAFLVQTFTVGLSGLLTQFDLAITGTPLTPTEGGFTVSLRDLSEAELFSTHVDYVEAPNIFATDWSAMLQFDLGAAAFGVSVGDAFSIAVISDPDMPSGTVTWLTGVDNTPFVYAGGEGFASYSGGQPNPFGGDFGFRTYVDTGAVPEPAAWALMILGFGLVGAAVRRRAWSTAQPAT